MLPSLDPATFWLSEMGMDDPYLVSSMQGDRLPSPADSSNIHRDHLQGSDAGMLSARQLSGKRPSSSTASAGTPYNIGRPAELKRRRQNTSVNVYSTASGPKALQDILQCFPNLKQELYDNGPCGSPSFHLDIGYSGEADLRDVQSVVTYVNSQSSSSEYGNTPAAQSSRTQTDSAHDHILAERRRREKLNERFIALSAVVPGLKKMDKATILGDAVKYVKQLQERVEELEEKVPNEALDDTIQGSRKNSTDLNSDAEISSQAEIQVRMMGRNVLVRVNCQQQKGVLAQCMAGLEKLPFCVSNANFVSFSNAMLVLTVNGQVEAASKLSREEIAGAVEACLGRKSQEMGEQYGACDDNHLRAGLARQQ